MSTPDVESRSIDALHPGRLASEQHPREVHVVAADVVQRPAAELPYVADVQRVVVEVREPAVDGAQSADPAGSHEIAHGDPGRMEAIHERLHEDHAGRVARRCHPLGVRSRHRQGLLAKDVLASPCGRDRPLRVEVVRQRDVDGVDVRVIKERFV